MTTRIFLVRHGETEWNKQNIFRGSHDVPLNKTGKTQARALGRYFAKIPLRAIYSSGLSRALATAKAIAKFQKGGDRVVHPEERLTDIYRGEWEGLTHEQAKEKFPELYEKWMSAPQEVYFPGGESMLHVQDRVWRAFCHIQERQEEPDVVVSHHAVIRILLCQLLDLSPSNFRRFEIFPASISEVRFEYGKWVLYRLNDVCHLRTR